MHKHSKQAKYHPRPEEPGGLKWKEFLSDMGKFTSAKILVNAAYIPSRTLLVAYLQRKGLDPVYSSIIGDMVCLPAYYTVTTLAGFCCGIVGKDEEVETMESYTEGITEKPLNVMNRIWKTR